MRAKEIDVIRTIVIFMLVLYHSFAPFTGGWDSMDLDVGVFGIVYKWIGHIAYAGMLETFVAISGYVYAISEQTRVHTIKTLVSAKFSRLIVPALIWGCLYWLLFSKEDLLTGSWHIINGIGHLWFLQMLFCCFLLEKGIVERFNIPLWVITLIAIIPYPAMPFHFNNALYYLLFFQIGRIIRLNYKCFFLRVKPIHSLYLIVLANIVLVLKIEIEDNIDLSSMGYLAKRFPLVVLNLLRIIYSVAIVFVYFILGYAIRNKVNYKIVSFIAVCSFGIYLLQEFIIRFLYYKTPTYVVAGVFTPWLGFLFGLVISLSIVYLSRKTKLGRCLF